MRLKRGSDAPLISVVVPTRNEAGNVEALVARLGEVLKDLPAEIVFVDDSDDETPRVLEGLVAKPPKGLALKVLHRPPERQTGLGSAAAEGLKAGTAAVKVVMDGDLQHPPELLRTMLAALEANDLDVVVASRYARGGSPRGLSGPGRRVASAVSRRLVQLLFREARKTSDPLSGYFVCRQSAIDGLEFRPIGFKILLEILVCASRARVGDVPLAFDKRNAGQSNASVAQGFAFVRHLWSLITQVPGSARFWKYAVVGSSGLALFLGLLLLGQSLGLTHIQSWALAFTVSLAFNWQVNRAFTFADVASPFTPGRSRPVYLPVALIGGCANLLVFGLLLGLRGRSGLVIAGIGGAFTAMAFNYLVHRQLLRRSPRLPSVAGTGMVGQAMLSRTQGLVRGDVRLLPADADEHVIAATFDHLEPPTEVLLMASARHRPILFSEAPSHVAQPRRDVGLSAWMGIPIVEGRHYLGLLVVHRQGVPFAAEELSTVMGSLRSSPRETLPPLPTLLVPDIDTGESV